MEDQEQQNTVKFNPLPKSATNYKKADEQPKLTMQDKFDQLASDFRQVVQYVAKLEEQVALADRQQTAATLELYDIQYKDCSKIKEEEISKEDLPTYIRIIGFYFKNKDNQVVKVIPIETGWKVKEANQISEENSNYKVVYEYPGVTPSADYPISYEIEVQHPYQGIMKLREYLFSLKESKIIL